MTKKKKLTHIVSRLRSSVHNADSFDRLVKLVNIASVHMGAREVLDVDGWTNVIRAADLDLDASDARRLYTWIQSTEGRKKNVLEEIFFPFYDVQDMQDRSHEVSRFKYT